MSLRTAPFLSLIFSHSREAASSIITPKESRRSRSSVPWRVLDSLDSLGGSNELIFKWILLIFERLTNEKNRVLDSFQFEIFEKSYTNDLREACHFNIRFGSSRRVLNTLSLLFHQIRSNVSRKSIASDRRSSANRPANRPLASLETSYHSRNKRFQSPALFLSLSRTKLASDRAIAHPSIGEAGLFLIAEL